LISDRRATRREADAREEAARLRGYELGRETVRDLLTLVRQAWDELVKRPLNGPVAPITSVDPMVVERKASLIPNSDLRRAGHAVALLLRTPRAFEKDDAFASITFPKGPSGEPPTVLKQALAVETLENMLAAYLREENPADFTNPLFEVIQATAEGMGVTVLALYDQA